MPVPGTPSGRPDWGSAGSRVATGEAAGVNDGAVYTSNIGGSIVSGCALGGPVAVARDPNKIVMLGRTGGVARPGIGIFSACGSRLATVDWGARARLRSMAWTAGVVLIALKEDGGVECFDQRGKSISATTSGASSGGERASEMSEYSFGEDVAMNGIARCCIWERGVAVVTHHNQVWLATFYGSSSRNMDEGAAGVALRPAELVAELDDDETVLSVCVLDSGSEGDASTFRVLVSTASGYLIVVEAGGRRRRKYSSGTAEGSDGDRSDRSGGNDDDDDDDDDDAVSRNKTPEETGPITMLSPSPNGNFLAGFTERGFVIVFSSDLGEYISKFDTGEIGDGGPPQQLAWCGNDSVLLYWDDVGILMVGPQGDWIKYTYDEPATLIAEPDGVRVITDTRTEFIGRVPDPIVSVFGIGSADPGALLYQALEQYDNFSASADESMRIIQADSSDGGGSGSLAEAVETCTDAALHEWDTQRQKTLMRAAAYGKVFLNSTVAGGISAGDGENGDGRRALKVDIREAVHTLRVLNTVRDPSVGFPISYAQLQHMTLSVLLNRLAHAHHHLHALRIADLVGIGGTDIIVHWACAKIRSSPNEDDVNVLNALVRFLRRYPSVSYAAIASHAYKSGRRKLAAMLLEYEKTASHQIPLLVTMGESEAALQKAVDCGDPDMVFHVLFNVLNAKTFPEFAALLCEHPRAKEMFIEYCRDTDPDLLMEVLRATGSNVALAETLIRNAYATASTHYQEYLESTDKKKDQKYASTANEMRLTLEMAIDAYGGSKDVAFSRKALEEAVRLHAPYSVSDAIRIAVQSGDLSAAQKLKSDFKVPEKRYYWIRIRAHASNRDWASLERFSREKFPSIGFMPFVECCVAAGAPQNETAKYIARIPDLSERASAFEMAGMLEQAMEAAEAAKNSSLLDRMRAAATTYSASQNLNTFQSNVTNVTSTVEKGFTNLRDKFRAAF